MGIFAGIGEDGAGCRRDDRLHDRAPAGISHEGDAEGFEFGGDAGLDDAGMGGTAQGDGDRNARMFRPTGTQMGERLALVEGKMRIAERDEIDRLAGRRVEVMPVIGEVASGDA